MTEGKAQLLRAKASVKSGSPPISGKEEEGTSWVTDLSFDDLRSSIAKAFAGIPDQVDGEPIFAWSLSQCEDPKVKAEALKFVLSFPINELLGKNHLDVSIQKKDGTLASTAVIVEYVPVKKNAFAKGWDKFVGGFRDFFLFVKVWRRDGIPELFTSNELKPACKDFESKGNNLLRLMPLWHAEHGPQGPHWYVQFVGTNPDCTGQGYGSQVMKKITELADQEKVDCYLECDSGKNKTFYEKFGFEVVETKALEEDPPVKSSVAPSVCLMIRRPRSFT